MYLQIDTGLIGCVHSFSFTSSPLKLVVVKTPKTLKKISWIYCMWGCNMQLYSKGVSKLKRNGSFVFVCFVYKIKLKFADKIVITIVACSSPTFNGTSGWYRLRIVLNLSRLEPTQLIGTQGLFHLFVITDLRPDSVRWLVYFGHFFIENDN